MRGLAVGLILLAIGAYVGSAVLPGAITNWQTANTSGWGAAATLWTVGGIVIVAVVLMTFLGPLGGVTGRRGRKGA